MDYSECDPLTDDYGKLAYNTHLDYISCQFAANEGTCGRSACECDVRLANSLYEFSYDFQQENTEMNYFDPAQQCKSSGLADGQAMMVDQCCGTSPNRNMFYIIRILQRQQVELNIEHGTDFHISATTEREHVATGKLTMPKIWFVAPTDQPSLANPVTNPLISGYINFRFEMN